MTFIIGDKEPSSMDPRETGRRFLNGGIMTPVASNKRHCGDFKGRRVSRLSLQNNQVFLEGSCVVTKVRDNF